MRVSQLAALSGVPATTLRFYEQEGLLPAARTAAGYRSYGPAAVDRLAFIGTAKHLGLPLAEIREVLSVWEGGACRDVRAQLRPRLAARLAHASARRRELACFERHLGAALAHLDALPARSSACDSGCSFLGDPTGSGSDAAASAPQPALACSLTGSAHEARTDAWRRLLATSPRGAVAGGYAVDLPSEAAEETLALVREEQRCCPFLTFRLQLDASGLRLEVTAPPEGQQLVDLLVLH
ncbi:Transcriptional regulator, MerR family [Modestobacter italicus]|uniref:Transcriptional regulator, MerR family n=2 Tax=Modestobacter italicus (strain DSM 44449 / CECT 9708 / BC 501) TaxID=2732864 RepID=I4EVH5_MODI5|nr:Transcriptional regulator, MerR family [Modestobacter marinus]